MSAEVIIAAIGAVVSVLLYFAGVKRGERQERGRQEHERQLEFNRLAHERELENDRQRHERELEEERREQEIASKPPPIASTKLGAILLLPERPERTGARYAAHPKGVNSVLDCAENTLFPHRREWLLRGRVRPVAIPGNSHSEPGNAVTH